MFKFALEQLMEIKYLAATPNFPSEEHFFCSCSFTQDSLEGGILSYCHLVIALQGLSLGQEISTAGIRIEQFKGTCFTDTNLL